VLGHGLAYGLVGHVDAEGVVQGRQDVIFALEHVKIQAVVVGLHWNLHVLVEEFVVVGAHGLEKLHVLHAAVHHGAAVRRDDAVGEVVAALDGALQQRAAVLAQEAGHVIGAHLHGVGARRAQPDGEGVPQVQKRLRGVFADVGDAYAAVALCLIDEFVAGILQQIFKIQQVFQIFH